MTKAAVGVALLGLACISSVPAPPSRAQAQEESEQEEPAASQRAASPAGPASREPLLERPGGYGLATLPVFSKVLFYLRENYYDKSRFNWKRMLLGALEFVERDVPEIVVEPLPNAAPDRVVVTVSGESRTFRVDRVDAAWSLRSKAQEILRFVQPRLQPVSEAEEGARLLDIEMSAVNGMLDAMDPQSVLLDSATYGVMRSSFKRPVGAIGVSVSLDAEHRIQVEGVFPGAPAEGAGVKVGDRIIRIDDEVTAALTLEDVVARFAGAIGSGLDLQVERAGARGLQKIHVERAQVSSPSMDERPRLLTAPAGADAPPAKIGYFHLQHLSADAAHAVARALEQFARERVVGIVVDLRGNSGGLYEQAHKVVDAFVKQGTLVSMVGVDGRQRRDEQARDDGSEPQVPVAVLVDHVTASGAEIIAGALRGLDRAIVLGQHTYGVGTVQVLFDIASPIDSRADVKLGLKLTAAQFLLPGDLPIEGRGLAPDVELHGVTAARVGARTLFRTEPRPPARIEGTYQRARAADAELQSARPLMRLDYLAPPAASELGDGEPMPEPRLRVRSDDFEAAVAAELLARIREPTRAAALAGAKKLVPELAAREDARIAAAAAALKIDWRAGARSAGARLALKIEPLSGATVRAGTAARLRGTVTNDGSAPAFRVRAALASGDPSFDGSEIAFGQVAPGQSKTFDLAVPIPPTAFTRTDLVRAQLRDVGGDVAGGPAETIVALEARPPAALSFTCRANEARTGGKVPGSVSINLAMKIRNQATVAAEPVEATVRRARGLFRDDDGVVFRVSRWSGTLAAGSEKEVRFVVELPTASGGKPIDLELGVTGPGTYDDVRAHMRIEVARDLTWQVTPAAVSATPPLVTVRAPAVGAGNTVHVAGEVNADGAARDVYIRVWNRSVKIPVRKVFYRTAPANSAQLPFEADVPIWPGNNIVTVSARDARGTVATSGVVVLRKD
jgi:carboxyl-terminal processing protease